MDTNERIGDKGNTFLYTGEVIRKIDLRMAACGTFDELNSSLGLCLLYVEHLLVRETIAQIQHDLFIVGAEVGSLSTKTAHKKLPRITPEHVAFLEAAEKKVQSLIPPQHGFLLPRGTKSACYLHLARTICRRAERCAVACQDFDINPEVIRYLNRLSDLLNLFARLENQGHEEDVQYT